MRHDISESPEAHTFDSTALSRNQLDDAGFECIVGYSELNPTWLGSE